MGDALSGRVKAPVWFWLVAVISLLWNSFGAYDYLMSNLSPDTYLPAAGMNEASIAYMKAFPAWLTSMWALGVWGSLAGSVLLLLRSRHAVTAFALSLFGLAVSQGYQTFVMHPPQEPPIAVEVMIWGGLIAFLVCAWVMARRGVLR